MNDWGKSVLDQYEIKIEGTRRGRGALLCDTDRGLKLLIPCGCTEHHLEAENRILVSLREHGFEAVDEALRNKEGKLMSEDEEHRFYVLKDWYEGAECSAERTEDWRRAVLTLARLHKTLRECPAPEEERNSVFAGESILEEYERHNKELMRVRNYVFHRKQKNAFERMIKESFGVMYELALEAEEELSASGYEARYEEVKKKGTLCHGSFHYHNVIMSHPECSVTNFQKAAVQIQLVDLYLFMRKILEKRGWKEEIGVLMLETYSSVLPIDQEELAILRCLFLYPEKYWKQLNFYRSSKKAWIPEKNADKLEQCIHQEPLRRQFIRKVLA